MRGGRRGGVPRFGGTLRLSAAAFALLLLTAECSHRVDAPTKKPPQAIRIRGWLHTSGREIVDSSNRPLRLNSINLSTLSAGQGAPGQAGKGLYGCTGWRLPDTVAYQNIAAWGFNSVRLIVSWSNLEPTAPTIGIDGQAVHQYNEPYTQAIDSVVHEFTRRGVAVILAMSQSQWSPAFHNIPTPFGLRCQGEGLPGWLYSNTSLDAIPAARLAFFENRDDVQAGYLAVWKFVAARYAANPMVIGADMVNEPFTHGDFPASDLHLNRLYTEVGAAIREANPNVLLIFQDNNYPEDQPFALRGPPGFGNEVYSFHFYEADWDPDGLKKTQGFLARAVQWNVPLWIGEFDVFDYSSSRPYNPNWLSELEKMLPFLRQNGISWSIWAYSGSAFLAPGGTEPKPGLLAPLQADF